MGNFCRPELLWSSRFFSSHLRKLSPQNSVKSFFPLKQNQFFLSLSYLDYWCTRWWVSYCPRTASRAVEPRQDSSTHPSPVVNYEVHLIPFHAQHLYHSPVPLNRWFVLSIDVSRCRKLSLPFPIRLTISKRVLCMLLKLPFVMVLYGSCTLQVNEGLPLYHSRTYNYYTMILPYR